MLFHFIRDNLFVQNVASWVHSRVPPVISHNLGKYEALKKALYLTALDQVDGDYLEFGVFTGSSFVFSVRMHRRLRDLGALSTRFFGFDSFMGFGTVSAEDRHPFYLDNIFRVDADRIKRNIARRTRGEQVRIVEGYFEETLQGHTASELGVERARVIFIDCDLKAPARLALDFCRPVIQSGTVIVLDDYFSYRGDPTLGVAGAFAEFNAANPALQWRRVCEYGYGGVVYIATVVPPAP